MARAIDADILLQNFDDMEPYEEYESEHDLWLDMRMEVIHAPTLTPQNELLTLDQLREMDGEPVWVELYRAWALVEVKQNGSIMFYGNSFSCSYSRTWKVYRFRPARRPPEGES